MRTDYLTAPDVLEIHEDQIRKYGGSGGVRDLGMLESALFRPQAGYYADLIEEAAALWESLSQNHPFIDGNKRTAFAATYTFLMVYGYQFVAGAEDRVIDFVCGLYETNGFRFEELVAWLRQYTAPTR